MKLRGPFDYAQGQDGNFYVHPSLKLNPSLELTLYVDRFQVLGCLAAGGLEGADALFDDQLVDGDVHDSA